MTPVRPIACLVVGLAALAAAALAASATPPSTPRVASQTLQTSGRFPVDIPGQSPPARAGAALRRGQSVISRGVTMAPGQRVVLTLLCPKGTVQRGLGIGAATTIAFEVFDLQRYIGQRRTYVRAVARVPSGKTAFGHVYGLCS